VGTAAQRFECDNSSPWTVSRDGNRAVVAIPQLAGAEKLARELGTDSYTPENGIDWSPFATVPLSLANLFSSEGLLSGLNGSFLPEASRTFIHIAPGVQAIEVLNLAARIALESATLRLPLVSIEPRPPSAAKTSVIQIGFHPSANGRNSKPGTGSIQILEESAGHVLCIDGSDSEGEAAALDHAALRLPNAWEYGKAHLHLSRIEEDLKDFFQLRSPAGQSTAVLKIARELIGKLSEAESASAALTLYADTCGWNFETVAPEMFPGLKVIAEDLNIARNHIVFDESFEFSWEVDEAREIIARSVIPKIQTNSTVQIELRISEAAEIRHSLANEIREQILDCGADASRTTVRVLSAHKQGYCWINEILAPRLENAKRIRIHFKRLKDAAASLLESEERWLHELYPIDEVLSKQLGIDSEQITFHAADFNGPETYEIFAEDLTGKTVLRESFRSAFVLRPMFDLFPDYAQIRVSTGWLQAIVDDETVADSRIATDPEKFWNCFQTDTLPKIGRYLSQLHGGKPPNNIGPHFGALEVDLWLSEPDHRIGIDEERISTLEPLHEDIYFETLLFFDLLGLKHPGRIIPRIHAARPGRGGTARIRFTGKSAPNARVQLSWIDSGGLNHTRTVDVLPGQTATPRIQGMTLQAGHDSVTSIDIAGIEASKENVALFETIGQLHRNGFELDWLSYEGIDSIRFGSVELSRNAQSYHQPTIQVSTEQPRATVQCRSPIGTEECQAIMERLAAFPQIHPFCAGTSLLGNAIWAMDVVAPMAGKYVSQAKVALSKPGIFLTGRQHANEVSSTTHILKLAETLVSEPKGHELLKRVNFILQPITNPDGANLVVALHKDTPEFMLHAGYLGSLGVDVTLEQWEENPIYPESRTRPFLWRMWLPDLVLNPHGYPSHEWVQLFAGYTAWVKSREISARDWWIPRGWFIPRFDYVTANEGAARNLHGEAMIHMHRVLATNGGWDQRMRRRYAKYGLGESQSTLQASKGGPDAFTFALRFPQITWLEVVSEAPDEVASEDWLETLTQTGLQFSLFCAQYLADHATRPERKICKESGTMLRITRKRP